MTKELLVKPEASAMVNGNTGEMLEVRPSVSEIASHLKTYMEAKPKKIFFNKKRYPEFDDWQYISQFFGFKVKTFDPRFVEVGGHRGFHAKAMVIDEKQNEIGRAESFCMDDEPNWRSKPLFQLASMAQTRAGAKALSNIFRPIAVLSGYEGTPAEEMSEDEKLPGKYVKTPEQIKALADRFSPPTPAEIEVADEVMDERTAAREAPDEFSQLPEAEKLEAAKNYSSPAPDTRKRISDKQGRLLYAKRKQKNIADINWKAHLLDAYGITNDRDIEWPEMNNVLAWIDAHA